MALSGHLQLAANAGEHRCHIVAELNENSYSHNRNEREDQSIFYKRLALLAFEMAHSAEISRVNFC